jgi:hypothetical protein
MVIGCFIGNLHNILLIQSYLQRSTSLLSPEKRLKLASNMAQQTEEQSEEVLSDRDVDQLVGTTDACKLPVSSGISSSVVKGA